MSSFSRRHFLRIAGATTLGFTGLHTLLGCATKQQATSGNLLSGYGALIPDPNGILDLPEGFNYTIVSRVGDLMSDGFRVPHRPDGMAAFPGPNGLTLVVRNHEVGAGAPATEGPFSENNSLLNQIEASQIYDPGVEGVPALGGTSTIVYNTRTQQVERQHLSLSGTIRNCAGGPTPWNSWITCEETTLRAGDEWKEDHGYNFEVPATADALIAAPIPLKAMGRFNHEAVAVHPATSIVYETEDRHDGLIYRFIPNTPENLVAGGRLQALVVVDAASMDTRNWENQAVAVGQSLAVRWMDVENVESPEDDLRLRGFDRGAARFARGEGMWYGNDAVYFACTNGGTSRKGQIWKYTPSPGEGTSQEINEPAVLELFAEPNDTNLVENCDNLTVAPWGDLIVCEDTDSDQNLVGITPDGAFYKLAKNTQESSELAGVTFSPDGSTLFVNIQHDGLTLAITGPWQG